MTQDSGVSRWSLASVVPGVLSSVQAAIATLALIVTGTHAAVAWRSLPKLCVYRNERPGPLLASVPPAHTVPPYTMSCGCCEHEVL